MPGTPLENLTVLVQSQGPAWRTSAHDLVNDAVRRVYWLGRVAAHRDIKDIVRGGDEIQDRIFLQTDKRLQRYNPNATLTGALTNPGVNYAVPWTFGAAQISWTKQHLGLNFESLGRTYRAQKYKDVMRQLKVELMTGVHETLDDEGWAPPDFTNMETAAATTRTPLSFPVLINEFANGLPVGLNQTSWTTKQQINPALPANRRWCPYQTNYTFDATASAGTYPGTIPLMLALGRTIRRTGLSQLPFNKEYSEKRTSPHVIWTQEQGIVNYEMALTVNQDMFRGMGMRSGQDPAYPGPSYRGIPVEWIEALDTALIYPTGTNNGTQSAVAWNTWNTATNTSGGAGNRITNIDNELVAWGFKGPRYYVMNLTHVHWAVHQDNFLVPGPVIIPSAHPMSRVQWWDIWNNLYASSLRTQGLVIPGAATVDAVAS